MNPTAEVLTQRFEPNVQLAKGQVIGMHNTGFTLEQWSGIKQALQSRGFIFKIGHSAL